MQIRKVEYQQFPYMIDFMNGLSMAHWNEAYQWCVDNLGEPFDNRVHSAVMDDKKWVKQWNGIRFKEEAYATWFLIRFSGEMN